MDDNDLMAAAVAGNLDTLSVLYEKYKLPLYAYFYKLTGGNREASEDLVHNVFYKVLKYKSQYRGDGSFAGWLFTIAHRAGIDYQRKEVYTGHQKVELRDDQFRETESNSLETDERARILLKALARLRPEEREILLLSKQDCLKYKEIATILHCSENVVKIRIFRALNKLRDICIKLENS